MSDPSHHGLKSGPDLGDIRSGKMTESGDRARHIAMVFDHSRDMMLLVRVEPGTSFRIVAVNRPYVENIRSVGIHCTVGDLEGRTLAEVIELFGLDAETGALVLGRFEQVFREGRALEFDEDTRTAEGVFQGRTTLTPILGSGGECEYLLYSSRDVSTQRRTEQALEEKERTLCAILDHSFQFIGLLDAEGRMIRANQTSLELVGVEAEAVRGRFFWDTPWWTHSSAEQARLREAVTRVARGEFVRFETEHRGVDGGVVHVDFSLKPVRDESGRVTLMIPEGRDITEHKQAEEALRLSEEKFHRAFNSSPNFIVISRLSDGLIIDVNETFSREYRVTAEEVRGRTVLELGVWKDAAERQVLLDELHRNGRVRDYFNERVLPDGRRQSLLISVEVIQIQGEPCLLSTSIDITAKTEAERALRESEEKFAKAFRASPYSMTISELETGRYIDINVGFERLSGHARAEVIGRTSTELGLWVNPADRDELIRRVGECGSMCGMEINFNTKDGRIVTLLCNAERIELAGRFCLLSVVEDITVRRRVEKEKALLETQLRQNQKLESLGTLAGGIAHDFNNILTAIIVNQELAAMDVHNPADLRLRLAEIARASKRAKDLVRQILTFSRQQPFSRKPQALKPLIDETLGFVRASLPSTIEIVCELAPDAPRVRVDETQIHQIVMNLCTNAAHAMHDAPGRLTVRLSRRSLDEMECRLHPGLSPGTYARLTIRDTGHGMDEAVLARIFEPFFTTKGPGEGTGLGLPMVHGIMKDYEGGIFVRSRPGEGSEFDLFFPEDREAEGLASPRLDVRPGGGESVLVVDDEPAICEAIGAMLRKIGYRVEKFSDPTAALERLARNPSGVDLLLTDRTMPLLTGPRLIAQAQRLRPGLPALLMSGLGSQAEDAASADAVYELVDKPPHLASLSSAVYRALASRRAL